MMIKALLNLLESNTLRVVTNPAIIVMVNFFFFFRWILFHTTSFFNCGHQNWTKYSSISYSSSNTRTTQPPQSCSMLPCLHSQRWLETFGHSITLAARIYMLYLFQHAVPPTHLASRWKPLPPPSVLHVWPAAHLSICMTSHLALCYAYCLHVLNFWKHPNESPVLVTVYHSLNTATSANFISTDFMFSRRLLTENIN